jgi:hypothetical protein
LFQLRSNSHFGSSGLTDYWVPHVDGRVLIYVHKEQMLSDVEEGYPAEHSLMIDDKLRIRSAMKETCGPRLTTVFPRQGHYAEDPQVLADYPAADVSIAANR